MPPTRNGERRRTLHTCLARDFGDRGQQFFLYLDLPLIAKKVIPLREKSNSTVHLPLQKEIFLLKIKLSNPFLP